MSFEYQGFATLGVNLNRQKYGPLDISNVFNSQQDLNYYLSKGAITEGVSEYWLNVVPYPYAGQIVALVNADRSVQVFVLGEKADGTFETLEVGSKIDLSQYSTTEEMFFAIENAISEIDLSTFVTEEKVQEKINTALSNLEIPENTDTKTTIVSGDEYINVVGDLVSNSENTFTVSINLDTLKALIGTETTAAMEFKGAISELPQTANRGDIYKTSAIFAVPSELDAEGKGFATNVGDSLVYDGEGKWYLIPSGDDVEDTWRPIEGINNTATLVFNAGDLLQVQVNVDGSVTYSHNTVAAPEKSEDASGNREYITGFETDGYGHIVSYTTAKETVLDTNDIYNAGDGINISEADENSTHIISIKIADNEKNLVLSDNGLTTNFDLANYATQEQLNTEKTRAEAAELALSNRIDEKVNKVLYPVVGEDGETTYVEGALLTPEEKAKLQALSIDQNGSVGISGTVSVDNVQGLGSWVTDNGSVYIKNLTEDNLSKEVNDKINFITSVDELNFTVDSGELKLAGITANQVTDLQSLLDQKVTAEEGSRLISHTEITLLESLAEGNYDNFIKAVNPDTFTVSDDGTLGLVAVPKSALITALGDLDALPNKDNNFTLVEEINNIYQMLTWSELT